MSELTVYKLNEKGDHVWSYPAVVLDRGRHSVRLEAFFNRNDLDLGFAVFARGDRFIECFYNDRWYNVFAVYDGDSDVLKGWYCNICRPAVLGEMTVHCQDLALDLWVAPCGAYRVLDEDEFAGLDITPQDRALCLQALDALIELAKNGRLPR